MKDTTSTARVAGYLTKIFRAINARYFDGQIEEPIVTIQSTPRAYGQVRVKWPHLWYDEITGWRYSMGTRKKFTPEELKHLRANPYTLRVTPDNIS